MVWLKKQLNKYSAFAKSAFSGKRKKEEEKRERQKRYNREYARRKRSKQLRVYICGKEMPMSPALLKEFNNNTWHFPAERLDAMMCLKEPKVRITIIDEQWVLC